ncbi:helix-turn-helix domain-containing protein [Rhodococcus sp. Q]|uniref:helix-turn-helix domain-containing protein n=1 Tax=Rhodococcus sp. Q TaxID=2502252 RepID=UPI0020161662|nr:helix-turn-helix domain-containing protein [Rhodococcus sp. Q]
MKTTTAPIAKVTIKDLQKSDDMAITRTTAAQALGVDPRTVTAGIENGTIPSVKLGRRVLIPRIPFLALFGAAND